MREGDFLVEENLKQEENLLAAESSETLAHEPSVEIVPETEAMAQDETPKSADQQEMPTEDASCEASEAVQDAPAVPETKPIPYHERYYLKYHEGKRSVALDLEGTRAFLQELGFDGGELRKARKGTSCAETFRNADKNKNNQMFCSYCGAEIAGVEFSRMPDGRMRCTTCSNTVITTKAEAEVLCQRVIDNMDHFFGALLDVSVSVEILEERKIKKRLKVSLDRGDSQSMLILGAAINKRGKFNIVLENGAPRISTIATFAHELTHIWQYTHWDNNKKLKKCPKNLRLLLYEGMAKWAEIQYLYLIGETNVARREEYITRNRQDEYGIGFCMYESYYPLSRETMSCEDTPFTPDKYPFD